MTMAQSDVPDMQIDSVDKTVCPRCGVMVEVSGVSAFETIECTSCRTQFSAPGKLAQYVLLRPIGHSATAVSFKGFDTAMSRHVEVKVLLKDLCDDAGQVSAFQAEARALASLDNRNVARAFFVGDEGGRPYSVTELIEGRPLSQFISADDPISECVVLKMAVDVAGVIRDLADKGMCHGRICPDNIIIVGKDAIKVVNFGVESDAEDVDSAAAPQYLAPEQIRGQSADFTADVYALGATMFHALTGALPFEGDSAEEIRQAHLASVPPDIRTVRRTVEASTATIVSRLLRADPAERCENGRALLADLTAALRAAETTRRARGGDAAAALSVLTGSQSDAPPAERPARARTAPPRAAAGAEPADDQAPAARKKRLILFGAVAAAAVLVIVLAAVLWPAPPARGGESFSGRGKHASAAGEGLVVLKGFDLPGWSVPKPGAVFANGALELSNGIGENRSLSRKMPIGAFTVRIDLKTMNHGPSRNYDIHIRDNAEFYITFSVRNGLPLVGTHHPEVGWRQVARGAPTTATEMTWELTLAAKDGRPRWEAVFTPRGERPQTLKIGSDNLAHYAHYHKRLMVNMPRTLQIVCVGYGAQMSVDHYERIAQE